jgi:predicted transcriptional regulator
MDKLVNIVKPHYFNILNSIDTFKDQTCSKVSKNINKQRTYIHIKLKELVLINLLNEKKLNGISTYSLTKKGEEVLFLLRQISFLEYEICDIIFEVE